MTKELELIEKLAKLSIFEILTEKLKQNPNGYQWKIRDSKHLKGLVWHQELGWGSVESVHAYHTSENCHLRKGGVESIAYTWAIRRNGHICLCNPIEKKPWSQGTRNRVGDENAEFMSVMFEGKFSYVSNRILENFGEPNSKQILSGLILWEACKKIWGWQDKALYGHFDFGKEACPGFTLETIIRAIRYER